MARVLAILEERYADAAFGVPQLREALGMSKTQTHRKISALTRQSPGDLIRSFRLQKAAQMIQAQEDSISQIAFAVGFNNLSYFSRSFKAEFGQLPSAFGQEQKP